MDNPKDFEEDENKLSKEELDALLKEVENDSTQVVRRKQPVKKKNIRFDMIIAAVIAFVIVVGGVLLVRHFVVNTPSKAEKALAENPLQDDKYPEITDVVKNYLNAFLIEDDAKRAETIAQYVGNLYDINSVKQRTYVSEYSDVECYTKKGPYDDTYVVYAYYQMGLKNIDTTVPAISRLYVVRDKKTGNVYIQNDSGDDIQKYMNKVTKDSDVQDLLKDVQEEFESVKASDPKVKAYYDAINAKAKKNGTTTGTSNNKNETTASHTSNNATTKASVTTQAPTTKVNSTTKPQTTASKNNKNK